nr:hypothetical protein [Tanacetum cinerariifolium]
EDDDNACVKIPLIRPIRSATIIHVGGNQSGGSVPSAAEGPSNPDSRGKAIMYDATDTPSGSVVDPVLLLPLFFEMLPEDECPSLFDNVPWRGIASLVSGLKKWVTDLNDKVTVSDVSFVKAKAKGKEQKKKIKSPSKSLDQFTAEAARLASNLNQAQRSDAQKEDQIVAAQTYLGDIYALIEGYKQSLTEKDAEILCLKSSPPEFAFLSRPRGLMLKKKDQIAAAQTYLGDIYALIEGYKQSLTEKDAEILCLKSSPLEFAFLSRWLSGHEQLAAALKKISYFMPGDQGMLIEATPLVYTTDYPFLNKIIGPSSCLLSALIKLKPHRLVHLAIVLTHRVVGVSPPFHKDSIVTPTSFSVELFLKDAPPSSTTTTRQNDEWLNAMVDTTDEEMVNTTLDNLNDVLVQGVVHQVCQDLNRFESSLIQESGFASFVSSNVVVALSVEKEKENAPSHSQDVSMTASMDNGDDVVIALFGV